MKDSHKFRNIEINTIQNSAKVLISTRYARASYTICVKFGKSVKGLFLGL